MSLRLSRTPHRLGPRGLALLSVLALGCFGCHPRNTDAPPPPDARRPELKSEAQLAGERRQLLASGSVVEVEPPTVRPEQRAAANPTPRRIAAGAGAIEGDILLVNDHALTVSEVLWPLRRKIAELRKEGVRAGMLDEMRGAIRVQTQQEVGSLLLYDKALSGLNDPQKESLDRAVDREIERQIANDFGGSAARAEAMLKSFGLTRDQHRDLVKRAMLVQSYARDVLAPRVSVRRVELIEYFDQNRERFSTPETRELLMIELPFASFLPSGVSWDGAAPNARAMAKLEAMRRARAAHQALSSRSFDDVAREFSRGAHADLGGSWGEIGAPLQAPYDELSQRIFSYREKQFSEPVETPTGWYIVGCGKVQHAVTKSFRDVQTEVRRQIEDERFNAMTSDYVIKLAQKASISALESFLSAAVRRAAGPEWPDLEPPQDPPAP